MSKTYIGDVGTVIVLDCGTDVSSATDRSIRAQKPNGTSVTWTASAEGTNSIKYTLIVGDLDLAGVWKLQALVTTPTGTWYGETAKLSVYSAFS